MRSNKNTLVKMLLNDEISIIACDTTQIVERAAQIHGTFPVCTAALGRTLTAATIMATGLKSEDFLLTININGGGPAGTVLATADANGNVKGCIGNPHVDLPATEAGKLDVSGAVGKDGLVTVVRDMGLKEPYVGSTQIISGEIAEDIANYYLKSEGISSIVYLSVWVDIDLSIVTAGGVFITPLPGASEQSLQQVEDRVGDIANYALMLMSMSPEEAMKKTFDGLNLKTLQTTHPEYLCDCSAKRLERVIISLGKDEITDMIEKDGSAEIVCRFCNTKYQFNKEKLKSLLEDAI